MALRKITPAKKGEQTKTAKREASVRKLTFSQEHFEDQEAVEKWLEENDWKDFVITEDDDHFVVATKGVKDEDFERINEIETDTVGVVGYVGQLTEEAVAKRAKKAAKAKKAGGKGDQPDDANDEAEGEDADEDAEGDEDEESEGEDGEGDDDQETVRAVKVDWYDMYVSNGQTVKDVLDDGMSDGLPPGTETIMSAVLYAVKNVLGSGQDSAAKRAALNGIGAEMAEIVGTVDDVFAAALKQASAKKTASVKSFVKTWKADIENNPDPDEEDENEDEGEDETETQEQQKPAPKAAKTKKGDVQPSASQGLDPSVIAAAIGKSVGVAVKDAMKPVQNRLGEIGKEMKSLAEKTDKATKAAATANASIDRIAKRSQFSQSSSEDASRNISKTRKNGGEDDARERSRFVSGLLGIPTT